MQDSNDQQGKESPEAEKANAPSDYAVFSPEEIRAIVREFLKAYVGGQIKIEFRSAEEIMRRAKFEKRSMNFIEAGAVEVEQKRVFLNLMGICMNVKESSEEEKKKATSEMMSFILSARSSHRIEGTFLTFDAEKRIGALGEDLDRTNAMVSEILVVVQSLRR